MKNLINLNMKQFKMTVLVSKCSSLFKSCLFVVSICVTSTMYNIWTLVKRHNWNVWYVVM